MIKCLFTKSLELLFQMLMSHLYGGGTENPDAAVSDMLEVREGSPEPTGQSYMWNIGDLIYESLIVLRN